MKVERMQFTSAGTWECIDPTIEDLRGLQCPRKRARRRRVENNQRAAVLAERAPRRVRLRLRVVGGHQTPPQLCGQPRRLRVRWCVAHRKPWSARDMKLVFLTAKWDHVPWLQSEGFKLTDICR